MTPDAKTYSVGELAKATGLTVRTLQHYDRIGLLPPSGRTDGGRRYYTDSDLIKLTQIVFYKSIGISLSEMREKLSNQPAPGELESVFRGQLSVLLQKMDALHMAFSVLRSAVGLLHSGQALPFELLARIIREMDESGLREWAAFSFHPALLQDLEGDALATVDGAMHFYHTMRALMVEAVALRNANTAPDHPAAQRLARRGDEDVVRRIATLGDGATEAALAVDQNREAWPAADRTLFEAAEPFLEAALAVYFQKNNLDAPMPGAEESPDAP